MPTSRPAVLRIELGRLHLITGERKHLPLSRLTDEEHVHGQLAILLDDRPLPSMGYFGPSDVCLGDWVTELLTALRTLEAADLSVYVYDEGEQGQPAFEFRREGGIVLISIIDSEITEGRADPGWQLVCCTMDSFREQIDQVVHAFRARLVSAAPEHAESWWQAHIRVP